MAQKKQATATNGEILAITQVLNKAARLPSLPSKGSYWIGRNVKLFRDAATTIEEQRKVLLDKYSEKDEQGKPITEPVEIDGKTLEQVKLSDEDAFRNEWSELLQMEVDVESFPIKLDLLGETIGITPNEMVVLDELIEAE